MGRTPGSFRASSRGPADAAGPAYCPAHIRPPAPCLGMEGVEIELLPGDLLRGTGRRRGGLLLGKTIHHALQCGLLGPLQEPGSRVFVRDAAIKRGFKGAGREK